MISMDKSYIAILYCSVEFPKPSQVDSVSTTVLTI